MIVLLLGSCGRRALETIPSSDDPEAQASPDPEETPRIPCQCDDGSTHFMDEYK